jgi:site-specific DNA-methyltransferase (adenine-specific)
MSESFLDGKVTLHRGDCLEVLPSLEADSIDSCVTDPPYGIHFMNKTWDQFSCKRGRAVSPRSGGTKRPGSMLAGSYDLTAKGMKSFQDFTFSWASLAIRVLKPGGHILCFSSTRTYHRMACAIEDAGFEIRDQIGWCYGSGFPKSHNIGNGWGTALKPAWEPCVLARKPLSESSIAANVLKHGTGGINVDGCRVEGQPQAFHNGSARRGGIMGENLPGRGFAPGNPKGRWPANLILDGSEEVLAGFPETGISRQGLNGGAGGQDGIYSPIAARERDNGFGDSGSAARFFYTAKADADDRLGSRHPTVKPLDLIQYLIRLITPQGGTVLDPFAGTGTAGEAGFREAMRCILIEREPEYQADIVKRMGLCLSGPEQRRAASVTQLPPDDLPMFGGGI